jgi:hypothetical protein
MKKLFTLAAAVLASFSLWAVDYYTPTAEEVVEVAVTGPAIATHAAIGNAAGTYTAEKDKTCCDPSDVSKTKSQFALDLKDGNSKKTLVLNIAGCDSICLYCDRTDRGIKAVFTPSTGDPETLYGPIGKNYTGFKLDPNKSYSITFTGVDSDKKGADVRVAAVRLIPGETCEDPEAVLTLSKKSMFVNEQAHLEFTTKGTSEDWGIYVLKDGDTATYGEDYSLSSYPAMYPVSIDVTPLTAGTFELTAFQESDGTYCAVDEKVTVTVSAANPVTAVTIDGPTAAYVGEELIYTATAANATDYEWYINEEKQGSDSAKLVVTAAKGSYSIVCKARNKFNAEKEWIASDPIALKVTNVSGSLISYTVETGSGNIDKDFTIPVGENNIIGGSGHQKNSKEW